VITSKLDRFEITLGLLDAAFAYLNIYHPTSEEKSKTEEAVDYLSKHWRHVGLVLHLRNMCWRSMSVPSMRSGEWATRRNHLWNKVTKWASKMIDTTMG
jgi:hypothetical protein